MKGYKGIALTVVRTHSRFILGVHCQSLTYTAIVITVNMLCMQIFISFNPGKPQSVEAGTAEEGGRGGGAEGPHEVGLDPFIPTPQSPGNTPSPALRHVLPMREQSCSLGARHGARGSSTSTGHSLGWG